MRYQFTTTDGAKFEIVCDSWSTRNAWGHSCKVYAGDAYAPSGRAKVRYYNRTWEAYQYQSVMKQAVHEMMGQRRAQLVDVWKIDNGRKRATKDQKAQIWDNDATLKTWAELYNLI